MKLNLKPLIQVGLTPEKIQEMANYLLSQINHDLYLKIRYSISRNDYQEMEGKFEQVKTDRERVKILEVYYQKATGENFIESGYRFLQAYFDLIGKILTDVKADLEKVNRASEDIKMNLLEALKKENYQEVKKILDHLK